MPKPTQADLDRLDRLVARGDSAIDYSDLPSGAGTVPADQPILAAIVSVMGARHMGRAALWEAAKAHHPTITRAEVDRFLKGAPDVRVDVLNALVLATGVRIDVGRVA